MLKAFFKLISYVFHPLFMMMYMLLIVIKMNPYLFHFPDEKLQGLIFIAVFFTSVLLPLVAIMMMRFLGFISSLEMEDAKERIGPFIVVSVCYIWLYLNIKNNSSIPPAFSMFVLGSTISLFIAFFMNNFEKISLHTIAASGLLMGVIITTNLYGQGYLELGFPDVFSLKIHNVVLIVICAFLLGLIGTARMYLKRHNLMEIGGGIIIGVVGQIFALNFYN